MELSDKQKDLIRGGWTVGKATPEEMAKKLRIPTSAVLECLKDSGLLAQKTDERGLPAGFTWFTKAVRKSGDVMALRATGMSIAKIAARTGVSRESQRKLYRSQGIPVLEYKAQIASEIYGADKYQTDAARTMNAELAPNQAMTHALLGMVSEAGEIAGVYQKIYQGHEPDPEHVKRELGDLLWFVAEYCTAIGWSLSDVMRANISKLKARYPDGFSAERSLHRAEGDV